MAVPDAPDLAGRTVSLRAVRPDDADRLRGIRGDERVRRWWGPVEPDFPFEADDVVRWTVLADGEVAGLVQAGEVTDPDYRHAGLDLFLDPARHGRGLGRDTVATVCTWLVQQRGHHRLVIDPAADNAAAIACYAAVGFRPVGVMRRYERGADGTFHDALLMDLLADELVVPD